MNRAAVMSLGNRALVLLITLAVLFFGVLAAASAKRELFPDMSLPMVMVSGTYQGAAPRVVESQVTEPLEQAVQSVPGVTTVTSTSSTGSSQVTVEFDYGQNQDDLVRQTQIAVDQVAGMLPEGVDTSVMSFSTDMMPVVMLAAGAADGDDQAMVDPLETHLIPELESVEGVRSATLTGAVESDVVVTPDEDELAENGLSPQSLVDALQSSGLLQPGGDVESDGRSLSVTTGDQFTSIEQVEEVWLQPAAAGADMSAAAPGAPPAAPAEPVRLSEVADVELVQDEAASLARVNGDPSIGVMVMKTPDGNTVEVSEGVQAVLDEQADVLGEDIDISVVFDQAPYINESIVAMLEEGGMGLLAAVIVILVFLFSIRSTLVIAVSIPVSVLIGFLGMQAFDFSLNMLTLAAITISIGRVVDDSIVVLENIRRHLDYGKERMAAVKQGVREVAAAVVSSTLATIAVFLPLAFVGGQVGEIFLPFAVTASLALAASLVVSITLIPVLCYWFMSPRDIGDATQEEIEREEYEREMRGPLQRAYLPVIRWITTKRRTATIITLLASVVIFGGTVVMANGIETDWMGQSEENTYQVVQELPPGTSLEVADEEAAKVEDLLAGYAWVESYQTNVGGGGMAAMMGGGGAAQVDYSITADPDTDQARNREVLRTALEDLDTEYEPRLSAMAAMGGSGIEVRVSADDQDTLAEAAGMVEEELRGIDGADDVANSISESQPALEVRVDGEEAAERGMTEAMIGQQVTAAFNGQNVGTVTLDDTRRDMVVRVDEAPRTVAELEDLPVTGSTGQAVPLSDVAEVTEVQQPPELTRIDGITSATVSASATGSDLGAVSAEITQALDTMDLPEGATATLGGVSQDQSEGFAQLMLAMVAAIVICYLIMVATFKSLLQPLMLLISVPFAITGSLALLLVTGTPLGVAGMVGMLMLIGVVITNAIVLMDLINQNQNNGMPLREAIVEGARHRLRPILMTALATVAALTPMALGITGGGAFISAPLAIVVIGGLLSSTVLTLILVPVLYQLVEWGRQRGAARRQARRELRRERKAAAAGAERTKEPVG
ncbi:efflux RND transporter permease subunit [Nocardiopsis sp. HUAS JQ3]|uniref:efflux RND transporter permease subunit n=1 Tax=Nocardiopsis sp. HUAS JQ3 TaxID=3061629 RepID=UPI0023AA114B|nr:efflux RND transporter permease subunit [Nocardiopsis sp. HUAS JQ3]WDZ92197.1 efflux RND transporter permease subunit [Nocardiopsis sp. HUAS JQ3]